MKVTETDTNLAEPNEDHIQDQEAAKKDRKKREKKIDLAEIFHLIVHTEAILMMAGEPVLHIAHTVATDPPRKKTIT
jgi:hypothetical protein